MEFILVFILAAILGIISGLIPGVTIFLILTLLYPLLLKLDPLSLIMIYTVVSSFSQYFGSVSAILFAIPGSTTSLPSLYEGHTLYKNGNGSIAIMSTAIGSFIGSLFSILLTLSLINFLSIFYNIFDVEIKSLILALSFFAVAITSENKFFINFIFLLLGLTFGHVGYDSSTGQSFLTFNNVYLYSGLPTLPIVLGIFVFPFIIDQIFKSENNKVNIPNISIDGYVKTLSIFKNKKALLLRHSFIGYISGFVPGISYNIGTTFSYFFEKKKKQQNKTYKPGDLDCLIAAETANNSGVYSSLLPLLFLSIPITANHALLYNIMVYRGLSVDVSYFQSIFYSITVAFFISSVIGLFLAGKYVNSIFWIFKINFKYLYSGIVLLLVILTFISGHLNYQGIYWVVCLLAFSTVGLLLKKFDKMPIIFGFLLYEPIFYSLKVIGAIYF